jgi:hypothetical protein
MVSTLVAAWQGQPQAQEALKTNHRLASSLQLTDISLFSEGYFYPPSNPS